MVVVPWKGVLIRTVGAGLRASTVGYTPLPGPQVLPSGSVGTGRTCGEEEEVEDHLVRQSRWVRRDSHQVGEEAEEGSCVGLDFQAHQLVPTPPS